MPRPQASSGGGILKAKVGPVPVPVLIVGVVAVGVWLFLRHRAKTSSTSAGSNATPATAPGPNPYPQGDSTGGGSGGLDLSSLLDLLGQQAATIGELSVQQPVYAAEPAPLPSATSTSTSPLNYIASGGGNVSPDAVAQVSQPPTTYTDSYATQTFTPPEYGADSGYVPGGTLVGSKIAAPSSPTTAGMYTSGGGRVYYQPNVGKLGKKPLY